MTALAVAMAASGRGHGRQWTDQQVIEELARWMAHGKLGATARRMPVIDSVEPVEEAAAAQAEEGAAAQAEEGAAAAGA